ncbi:MAG: membrane protein insertase YidC, partial [Steroidobacteraceae bacterium]
MTKNPRLFLWLALALALWFNYEAWVRDYGESSPAARAAATQEAASKADETAKLDAAIPQASSGATPAPTPAAPASSEAAPTPAPVDSNASAEAAPGVVRVRTDVLDMDIGLTGGELQRADLLKYPRVKGGSERVRLLNRDSPETLFVLQSGLTGPQGSSHPTHLATFTSPRTEFALGTADELRVPLTWTNGEGITLTKTFVFRRGQYRIDLEYHVQNASGQPWQAAAYAQILRSDPPIDRSMFKVETYAFRGPAMYD